MKSIFTSSLLLLASHLALARVISTPTALDPEPPTRVKRAVGDTTTVPLSATETWTLTITLQNGSGNDYDDDDDLSDTGVAFANAVGSAPSSALNVTAMHMDMLGNSYELDLDLSDDVTIGSKTNAYWAAAGNSLLAWTQYQEYPTKLTAKASDNGNNNMELGFYEFTYTPK
ncbi:hypothetical protein PRZ48_012385 [Zasmidium cellare]|uniref:Uncharacterized protein n=1 Tax=Zasmidium cellare TaxID=395010 RepID=A0ABR0E569_ZASCE|nr:hypothetical protein PRZ48_012385 [Zasmidium cellare]